MNGIQTSGLGAISQRVRIDVIANNLANANTTAFRRDTVTFQERLVEALEDVPDLRYYNALVDRHGGAPFIASIDFDRVPGGYERTGRALDAAIEGEGFFALRERGSERRFYTRAGNFTFNAEGRLTTADGRYDVLSTAGAPIETDPGSAGKFTLDAQGTLYQENPGGELEALATLAVRDFDDYARLEKHGDSAFRDDGAGAKDASGYRVNQGFLERASADPLTEMVDLIRAMRALESNLQMVRLQDATVDRLVNDFGRLQR